MQTRGQAPTTRRGAPVETVHYSHDTGALTCTNEYCMNWDKTKFCSHISEWLDSRRTVMSMLAFSEKPMGRILSVPIAAGLAVARMAVSVNPHPRDENRKLFTVGHVMRHEESPVVHLDLDVEAGETLGTAVRAIEGFYRAQPEYAPPNAEPLVRCSERQCHDTYDFQEYFQNRIVNVAYAVIDDAVPLANAFSLLNSKAPPPDGLCFVCNTLEEERLKAHERDYKLSSTFEELRTALGNSNMRAYQRQHPDHPDRYPGRYA